MLDRLKRHDLLFRVLATCVLAALLMLLARSGPAPATARSPVLAASAATSGALDEAMDWAYQNGHAMAISMCARLPQGTCVR